MILYQTVRGLVADVEGAHYRLADTTWDELFCMEAPLETLEKCVQSAASTDAPEALHPPIGRQEVWASGVTYTRSRSARMEESKEAGGGGFYDRVYAAERPELFFKAAGCRVVGHGQEVRIRRDSRWSVPEPELALAVSAGGRIIGYAVGNDMSARDIEGANPLYLPQAKVYDGACALGPGLLVQDAPLPDETEIALTITRKGELVFEDRIALAAMKRTPEELVEYLYREMTFPHGCYLMTGTGIVPPDTFALQSGDRVRIRIESVGTLENPVA